MAPAKIMKAVSVEWKDITSHSGWHDVEDNALLPITSVGFLMAQDKDNILISQSISPENSRVAESLLIPMSVVAKIRRLR